jgi:hypothetical protein
MLPTCGALSNVEQVLYWRIGTRSDAKNRPTGSNSARIASGAIEARGAGNAQRIERPRQLQLLGRRGHAGNSRRAQARVAQRGERVRAAGEVVAVDASRSGDASEIGEAWLTVRSTQFP